MTDQKFGMIQSVDTGTVTIHILNGDVLNALQVNQLLTIKSTNSGESIIALISKIMRKTADDIEQAEEMDIDEMKIDNLIKAQLIGTWFVAKGTQRNVFKRSLEVVPSIGSEVSLLEGNKLKEFMGSISSEDKNQLELGNYTIHKDTIAYLDGNKFFQRHAVVVGGTGSGKSWTIANIIEKAAVLPSVNSLIFDLHGEYQPLSTLPNTTTLKIAGPSDNNDDSNIIFLPYWLLTYEEIEALILDRSDNNAPNQARAFFDTLIELKKHKLKESDPKQKAISDNFTIDSPLPYDFSSLIEALKALNMQEISTGEQYVSGAKKGQDKTDRGPLYGKLPRFIQRLESKQNDKRLNFLFNQTPDFQKYEWLDSLVDKLMAFEKNVPGSKIIDFSEVPSDVLPLITGLVSRLVFSIQQWTEKEERHPIALFCDEAHLYIPNNAEDSIAEKGLHNFERISKEGRKYGVSLIVISQRPADVSKTVLSQCGNFIAMRLTNPDDQNVIRRLFPDSLGGFSELLPILDIGECLIVGDACLLPSRIKINEPEVKPASGTVDIWTEWQQEKDENSLHKAVQSLRQQSKL